MDIQTAKKILQDEGYLYLKYVRTDKGFVFADASNYLQPDHKNMISEGETVISASYLKITKNKIVAEEWSRTLMVGPAQDDEEILMGLFFD